MKQKNNRIIWLDVLKGLGIILVLYGHIFTNTNVFNWIYSFHMPIFFFASGFLYKKKNIKEYIKHKFFSIIIPYIFFGLIELIYWIMIESKFRTVNISYGEAIIGLCTGYYDWLEFNVHLWFLPCMFIIMILYNILVNLIGHQKTFLVTVLLSVMYIFIDLPNLWFSIDKILMYIGFYALGNFCNDKKYYINIINIKKIYLFLISILLYALNATMMYYGLNSKELWFITALLGLFATVCISIILEKNEKILPKIGKISLIILCVHGPIYRILIKILSILSSMSVEDIRENFIFVSIIVIIDLVMCFCVSKILDKLKFFKIIGKK